MLDRRGWPYSASKVVAIYKERHREGSHNSSARDNLEGTVWSYTIIVAPIWKL
jgi:hypothetical protein